MFAYIISVAVTVQTISDNQSKKTILKVLGELSKFKIMKIFVLFLPILVHLKVDEIVFRHKCQT